MNKLNFMRQHQILIYFILTFLISWGGVFLLGYPYGMPTTKNLFAKEWPIVFIPYFIGPCFASLLLIGYFQGKSGFEELKARYFTWNVKLLWFAIAILTAPLFVLLILAVFSITSSDYVPKILTTNDKIGLLLQGIIVGIVFGGIMEEIGWTGIVVPRMREKYSIFITGLLIGFLWGIWHILPTFWGSGDEAGKLSLTLFLPPLLFYIAILPAYRIQMVWVHDRTKSLFVIMFMHASLTASTLFILAPEATGDNLIIYYLLLAFILWTIDLVGVFGNVNLDTKMKPASVLALEKE